MSKAIVMRRCVACKKLLSRQYLWRVVRDHQNGIQLDDGMGRSAYLCPNGPCLEEARRRKRLQKALRCQVPEDVVALLQQRLNSSRRYGR